LKREGLFAPFSSQEKGDGGRVIQLVYYDTASMLSLTIFNLLNSLKKIKAGKGFSHIDKFILERCDSSYFFFFEKILI
jgi:hypothetical protein